MPPRHKPNCRAVSLKLNACSSKNTNNSHGLIKIQESQTDTHKPYFDCIIIKSYRIDSLALAIRISYAISDSKDSDTKLHKGLKSIEISHTLIKSLRVNQNFSRGPYRTYSARFFKSEITVTSL